MDNKQLLGDSLENAKQHLSAYQANIWTALPVAVIGYNPVNNTVKCQPLIQGIKFPRNAKAQHIDLPVLVDVPVIFTQASGCTITVPINAGDEGIVIFASRCIDGPWYHGSTDSNGNIQTMPALEMRMHDLSDGMFLPGSFSLPRVIPTISTTKLEIRNNINNTKISLDPVSFNIEIIGNNSVTINAPVINLIGDVGISGTLTANGHVVDERHTHSGVMSGGSNTGTVST